MENSSADDYRKPLYWKECKHSYSRRAKWHDYTEACHYMVTIVRNKKWDIPFSEVRHGGVDSDGKIIARVDLSAIGKILLSQMFVAEQHFPNSYVREIVVMPDHIHAIVYIHKNENIHLGTFVKFYKGNCTKLCRELDSFLSATGEGVFEKGYNDRIVHKEGLLSRLISYVRDNPRRHLMRNLHKDYFKKHLMLVNGKMRFVAFGNIHLLKDPFRSALIVSSRYSPEDRKIHEAQWESTAAARGVFVSPFISLQEKRLMNEYLDRGARMIKIVEHGFWERFKPQGKEFELCSAGRLLLVGELDENVRKRDMSRNLALELNARAREIAGMEEEGWKIRGITKNFDPNSKGS